MSTRTSVLVLAAGMLAVSCRYSPALADPCGMVPPVYIGEGPPITRVGLQQTYVFYKDGVETFVIRPGFTGKVDEFGMLIPFPTPPAIRKVPDHIFPHLAAAVDPPEVVVDVNYRPFTEVADAFADSPLEDAQELSFGLGQVRVLRQEAVGMYEVAVLEAGSAAALKRWMDDHGYKYPEGMDKACEDYVDDGWCFVAVKTKVGQKQGVDPQPGQRTVNAKLPDGSVFDGAVQGMGFRFKSDKLVVPMRLSSFNAGELRNVVYLLTDGPKKIRAIPEEYVVRQLTGEQLIGNVTNPLPLRIIGGTEKDIPEWQRKSLPQQRDPAPHNAAAKGPLKNNFRKLLYSTGASLWRIAMDGYEKSVEVQMVNFYRSLSEKDRRRYAAVEAGKLRHGGVAYIARLFGCDPDTIRHGMADVERLPQDTAEGRVRKKGGPQES